MNKNFIEADRYIYRDDVKNEVQIRLISDDTIMYANLNVEQMKKLRDFLNTRIERCESKKVED